MTSTKRRRVSERERLTRLIAGSLTDCIAQHGPVTADRVRSAAKRIAGQLTAETVRQQRAAVEHLQRRLARLRHGHERTLAQLAAARARLVELERTPDPQEAPHG